MKSKVLQRNLSMNSLRVKLDSFLFACLQERTWKVLELKLDLFSKYKCMQAVWKLFLCYVVRIYTLFPWPLDLKFTKEVLVDTTTPKERLQRKKANSFVEDFIVLSFNLLFKILSSICLWLLVVRKLGETSSRKSISRSLL